MKPHVVLFCEPVQISVMTYKKKQAAKQRHTQTCTTDAFMGLSVLSPVIKSHGLRKLKDKVTRSDEH